MNRTSPDDMWFVRIASSQSRQAQIKISKAKASCTQKQSLIEQHICWQTKLNAVRTNFHQAAATAKIPLDQTQCCTNQLSSGGSHCQDTSCRLEFAMCHATSLWEQKHSASSTTSLQLMKIWQSCPSPGRRRCGLWPQSWSGRDLGWFRQLRSTTFP